MTQKTYQEVLAAAQQNKETYDIPYDSMPEERGSFQPVPQPGKFRFQIPATLTEDVFDIMEAKEYDTDGNVIEVDEKDAAGNPTGKKIPKTKQRLVLVFEKANALTIVQSKNDRYNGEEFRYRINFLERLRGKREAGVKVSDGTYLLRAVAPQATPKTMAELIQICLQVLPGKQFAAELEYQGSCNPEKDAYFAIQTGEGDAAQVSYDTIPVAEGAAENLKGCGARIYHSNWPKDRKTGEFLERATCPGTEDMPAPAGWKQGEPKCGAAIRPFPQLVRFGA